MRTEHCSEDCDGVHGGEHCALQAAIEFVSKVGCYGYAHEVLRTAEKAATALRTLNEKTETK